MGRALFLIVVVLAGCESETPMASSRAVATVETPSELTVQTPPDSSGAPFDASDMVFEPTEPPDAVVEIPPRPPPTPSPLPAPDPSPTLRASAGRCDVRESEGFCFAYTGDAWTVTQAREQCTAAPDARFSDGVCPVADRIATCTFERPSAPGKEIVYTYYEPYDPTLAELACPGAFALIE